MKYQRIRDLREDHDLTQAVIAKKLYISQQTYSQYENGKREIPVCILRAIARLYNTSIDYLLGETSNPNRYDE